MTENFRKTTEKDRNEAASKPEKLAKILYGAIVRYVKAKNAGIGEKTCGLAVDFSRERRVNVVADDVD